MADKPNILVIWGDDIGITNLSCYSDGLMGYRTPNIDRIADEGMRFTDAYGEQSCTAGRASFITGQSVFRTGLSKVGLPAAPVGLQAEDPTIAELLKNHGYATAQFGKNHVGDKNKFLPTVTASIVPVFAVTLTDPAALRITPGVFQTRNTFRTDSRCTPSWPTFGTARVSSA